MLSSLNLLGNFYKFVSLEEFLNSYIVKSVVRGETETDLKSFHFHDQEIFSFVPLINSKFLANSKSVPAFS